MAELEFGLTHIPPSFHWVQSGICYQTTREPEDPCPSVAPAWPGGTGRGGRSNRAGASPQPSCRTCTLAGGTGVQPAGAISPSVSV